MKLFLIILVFIPYSFSLTFLQRLILRGIIYKRKALPQVNLTIASLAAKYNSLDEQDKVLLESLFSLFLE